MPVGAEKMFHDQHRDYATTLTHAYEHTSIFAWEVGHPAELMLMCQSVPLSPQSRASSLCMPASPETTQQHDKLQQRVTNKPTSSNLEKPYTQALT